MFLLFAYSVSMVLVILLVNVGFSGYEKLTSLRKEMQANLGKYYQVTPQDSLRIIDYSLFFENYTLENTLTIDKHMLELQNKEGYKLEKEKEDGSD